MVKRNIIISKAGGNSSGVNYKVSLPAKMVKALGVTAEDRDVELELIGYGWMGKPFIAISKKAGN